MFDRDWETATEEQASADEIHGLTTSALREWNRTSEPATHAVPGDLSALPPGPCLSAILSTIRPSALSGHDAVTVLKAMSKLVSHNQASLYQMIEEIAHRDGPGMVKNMDANEFAAAEVAAALRLTRRSAALETDLAADLCRRRPEVLASLRIGDIDLRRARVIVKNVSHLEDTLADEVVERVLPFAHRLTTGQLAARIQRLAIEVDPESAQKKRREGVIQRRDPP